MSTTNQTTNLIASWLEHLNQQGKSRNTTTAYQHALEHFIAWNDSIYHLPFDSAAVMPRDVRDWKAWQQSTEKAAPATINQRLVALSRFYSWAITHELVHNDPTAEIGLLRLPPREPKGIPDTTLRRLLRQAKDNPRDYAIIELLAGTGLRVGELLALRIGDVKIGERSGKVIVRHSKHNGYREVPLTVDVRQALGSYLTTHSQQDNPDSLLWGGTRGPLTNRSSVMRILNRYAHLAGIEEVSPHALRHTFATRYLKANPDDLRGLARLLGHANLNTVMIYTEPDMDDLTERMERVDSGG